MVRLIAQPTTNRFPPSKIMVKWVEADDDEDDNVYNEERYPSALLKSYVDPWAEERRPWLLLKFGYSTVAIRNEDLIWRAMDIVTEELSRRGIFLKRSPLYYSLSCLEEKQIAEELHYKLKDIGPDIYPVLLLVDDCNSPNRFRGYGRTEPPDHQYSSRDYDPDDPYLIHRQTPRSECRNSDKTLSHGDRDQYSDDWDRTSVKNSVRNGSAFYAHHDYERCEDGYYSADRGPSNERPHFPGRPPSETNNNRNRSLNNGDIPSGNYCETQEDRQSTPVGRCEESNDETERFEECVKSPPDDKKIATARDVELALDYVENNRSDPDIVAYVAVPYLFNRLKAPFQDMLSNISLMRLIDICCSVDAEVKDVYDGICHIIQSLVSSSYIQTVCNKFGYPAAEDTSLWNQDLCDLFVAIMKLFLLADKYGYNGEETCNAWKTFYGVLTALPEAFWCQAPKRRWLEDMAARLMPQNNDQLSPMPIEEQRASAPVNVEEVPRSSERPAK
ncbi:hypothetical protein OESDEN_13002 [Oesophagostomum dentatum]|uniref:Uncharacterized protein n=1 Tax=Oesophagostomum dentatum TaxID=61180 RepID=A0A0B1SPJ1_OESDE|nr:hypothetical protein OESDEN_13002 [Oesophagostomum dentatum]